MSAETIAKALGGRKAGDGWIARCPVHHDRTPSLSIRQAANGLGVLVHCHAGCDQLEVISALKRQGLWESVSHRARRGGPKDGPVHKREPDRSQDQRSGMALTIWKSSRPAPATAVETYLGSRGIYQQPPTSLRCHSALKHPSGGEWPAMVALVTKGVDGTPMAIHRTFLARDGGGKAPVDPQKMMLGSCRGGAVRLANPDDTLMVGEGIETCLAAMQASGRPAWAALSTSGLRALELPEDVRHVIVLADGDETGEAAARDCALRWKKEGRRVRIARPPRGSDFNDMLLGRAPGVEGGSR